MMTISEQFLTEVEGFLAQSGMTPTSFGKAALSDPNFVFALRKGRSPSIRTIERVQEFISQHQSGDAA